MQLFSSNELPPFKNWVSTACCITHRAVLSWCQSFNIIFDMGVKSQLKRLARPMYSNPPIHRARIVANVVGSPELFNEWKKEMEMMAGRIKSVRQKLYDSLCAKDKSGKDWSLILEQIGMFSFTRLSKTLTENITNKWHVCMTRDGRISLAGLSSAKCEYLADAIVDSCHNVK